MLAHVLAARRDSSDGTLFLVFLAAILVGVALALYFGKSERLKRKLRRTPVRKICAVHAGKPVRVIGRAQAQGAPLAAPLTGRPCLYYCAEVSAMRGKRCEKIICEARGVPFLVDDGSGLALVDPRRADLVIDTDASSRSGAFDSASPLVAKFLARHAGKCTGLRFSPSMHFSEAIIEVGERVAVLGAPRREPDRTSGAPVELRGSLAGRLVICDARSTMQRWPQGLR